MADISTAQLLALEERRREAALAGDADALAALMSDRLAYVHSTGGSDTKAGYVDKIRAGSLRFHELAFTDLQAQPLGPGAGLVRGRMQGRGTKDGQPIEVRSLYLVAWALEPDGAWRLQAHQGTPAPKAPA